MTRKPCRHCGKPMRAGLAAIHLSGQCQTAWYRRAQQPRPKRPEDLPAEQIERIMARVALEQRYRRAREAS